MNLCHASGLNSELDLSRIDIMCRPYVYVYKAQVVGSGRRLFDTRTHASRSQGVVFVRHPRAKSMNVIIDGTKSVISFLPNGFSIIKK